MLLALAAALVGCPRRPPAVDPPVVTELRPVTGEVRVVPGLGVHAPLAVELGDYLGGGLASPRVAVRSQRTAELGALSSEVGLALPGAVGGKLGEDFLGTFRATDWPDAARAKVVRALERGHGLDEALGAAGRAAGGEALLVTWVDRLEARPLSLDGAPGDMIDTPRGQVVVDHADEPYLVDLGVGMALVSGDGQVLLRFREDVQTILSAARPPPVVGREVARHLAEEVARTWTRTP